MATWNKDHVLLTTVGRNILSRVQSGVGHLNITRVRIGGGYVTPSNLESLTAIILPKQEAQIMGITPKPNGSFLDIRVSNEDITSAYSLYQIGVYVTHPDYPTEQLYMVAQCDTSSPDVVPPSSQTPLTLNFGLYITHSKSAQVEVVVTDAGSVSQSQLQAVINQMDTHEQTVLNALGTKVSQSSFNTLNTGVTNLTTSFNSFKTTTNNALNGKATTGSVSALSSELTQHKNDTTTALSGKASTSSVSSLSSKVTTNTGSISTVSDSLNAFKTSTNTALSGKASTGSVGSVSTSLQNHVNTYNAFANATNTALNGKASTGSVNTLDTKFTGYHTGLKNDVTALSSRISSVEDKFPKVFVGSITLTVGSGRQYPSIGHALLHLRNIGRTDIGIGQSITILVYNGAPSEIVTVRNFTGEGTLTIRFTNGATALSSFIFRDNTCSVRLEGQSASYGALVYSLSLGNTNVIESSGDKDLRVSYMYLQGKNEGGIVASRGSNVTVNNCDLFSVANALVATSGARIIATDNCGYTSSYVYSATNGGVIYTLGDIPVRSNNSNLAAQLFSGMVFDKGFTRVDSTGKTLF